MWTFGCERVGEGLKQKRFYELSKSQNKLQGRFLFLSLASFQTSSCFHPAPPNPPSSPSFYLFLLHPTHPACSNLWQMMVGWHQNGATGRETAYTPQGSDKRRETPIRLPPLLLQCANTFQLMCKYCACSLGLKASRWLLMALVHLCKMLSKLLILFC